MLKYSVCFSISTPLFGPRDALLSTFAPLLLKLVPILLKLVPTLLKLVPS